jgi:hypothetical protein
MIVWTAAIIIGGVLIERWIAGEFAGEDCYQPEGSPS